MGKAPERDRISPVRAGVVGAGQMGAGIAGTLVKAGIATTLVDVNSELLASAEARVSRIAESETIPHPLLTLSMDLGALRPADVIIEAITEDLTAKTALFQALGRMVRSDALLASNTSTIPISQLAQNVEHPERFGGMHFFHPVRRMELVEVIRGDHTSTNTIAGLVALARRLGKSPIVVGDGPGFFTTRVLSAYLDQALRLVEAGVSIDEIDGAAVAFGMPIGPIALLDLIGLDTALAIARVMSQAFPDRFHISRTLEELVQAGKLGRKSKEGFRSYGSEGGSLVTHTEARTSGQSGSMESGRPGESELIDRLILPMLLEAIRTLEEGIVTDPRDADLGTVLGLGFPASSGGIISWCEAEGPRAILERLTRYDALGEAFRPPSLLVRLAGAGDSFQSVR